MRGSKQQLLRARLECEEQSSEERGSVGRERRGRSFYHTLKAKAAIRESKLGRRMSHAQKLAISEGKFDYRPDQDHCDAISRGMKRRWADRKKLKRLAVSPVRD